jgi:hypothetical protein
MRAVALLLAVSCGAGSAAPTAAPGGPTVPTAPAKAAPAKPAAAHPAALPEAPRAAPLPGRIVAIGDVHGDLDAALAALKLAGVVDGAGRWTGGDAVVVQVGDQLDRGDQEEALLERFEALQAEAKGAGGAFWALLGNHELMNVAGDLRYVTPGGFTDFADVACPAADPDLDRCGRRAAFAPGGEWAVRLADQPVVLQLGDTVFVHGGLLPEHVRYGVDRLTAEAAAWLRGEGPRPAALSGDDAPVWSRRYSDDDVGPEDCEAARTTLAALGAARMVVGHTVQKQGINAVCDGLVWRVDVGLSRHYGGRPQALVIDAGAVTVKGP